MKVGVRTALSHGGEDCHDIDPKRSSEHLAFRHAAEDAFVGLSRTASALLRARLPNGPVRR